MRQNFDEQFDEKDRDAAGDLSIKKSRILDTVAKVVTLVLAVTIWLYVVATNVVEKPLPLTVKEKNGLDFTDRVSYEKSLIVRGASAIVDPLQQLQLEDFSAKTLNDADGDGVVDIELSLKEDTLPEGVSEVLKADGSSFAGGKVKVTVSVKVGHAHELKVPKSYVTVSNSEYEMVDEFVTLTIRSLGPEDDHALFNQLNAYLDPNNTESKNAVISVFANIPEENADLSKVPITVTFGTDFKNLVYEVNPFVTHEDGTVEAVSYTVAVQPKTVQEVIE